MENLEKPKIDISKHKEELRLRLLNSKKSSRLGLVLIALPCLFIFGMLVKEYLGFDFGLFTYVYDALSENDRRYGDTSVVNWLFRLLVLAGLPLAVYLNITSLLFVRYEKDLKELFITLKIRWLNLLIVIISLLVFFIFLNYLIAENISRTMS
jgi:hypothetical protein